MVGGGELLGTERHTERSKKGKKKRERLQFYPSGNTKKALWLVTLQKREEKQGGCMNLWIRLLFGGGLWKYLAIICVHKNSQVSQFDRAKKLQLIRISRWAFIYRVDQTVQWVQPRAQKYCFKYVSYDMYTISDLSQLRLNTTFSSPEICF